jgi:hypothetical protein
MNTERQNILASIPIVFVHKGNSWYLPWVLRQALSVNNGANVALIADTKRHTNINGIESFLIDDLQIDLVKTFQQSYKHISTNSQNYEIFCWLRWFYLFAYMEKQNINHAFYLDSDVLIFTSPEHIVSLYPETVNRCAFMIPQQSYSSFYWCAGGHLSYWTRDALREFCNFTIDTFVKPDLLNIYNQKWNWHINNKVAGGICDMTTLYLFSQKYSDRVINFLADNREGIFDMNFNSPSNFLPDEFEMQNTHKKVNLHNNKPAVFKDGKLQCFHNIHFQGWAKHFIPEYYQGVSFKETTKHYLERIIYSIQRPLKTKLKPLLVKVQLILKDLYK